MRADRRGPCASDEVPRLLAAWRPLFATAIWTGMRKGELLGLQKNDIDFVTSSIAVRRSYDHETTKGELAWHLALLHRGGGIGPVPKAALCGAPEDAMKRPAQLVQALRRQLVALVLQKLLDPGGGDLHDGRDAE